MNLPHPMKAARIHLMRSRAVARNRRAKKTSVLFSLSCQGRWTPVQPAMFGDMCYSIASIETPVKPVSDSRIQHNLQAPPHTLCLSPGTSARKKGRDCR